MTAVFNTKTLIPSRMTSTRQGHFASEMFTLISDHTTDFDGVGIKDLVDASESSSGDVYRVNSSGWSKLLVWEIFDVTGFRGSVAKPIANMAVIGKKDIYNTTGHPLDTSAVVDTAVDIPSSDYGWFPCPVLNSHVRVEMDSNATPANTPPQGSHNVGSMFTFSPDRAGTSGANYVEVSSTNDTVVSGPAMIDVSGTKEIALLPVKHSNVFATVDTHGYVIGQFIS